MRKKQQNTRINAKYKKRKICYSKLHEVSRSLKFSENLDTTRTVNIYIFFEAGGEGGERGGGVSNLPEKGKFVQKCFIKKMLWNIF